MSRLLAVEEHLLPADIGLEVGWLVAQLDVVVIFLRDNTTEVIDPLDAKTKCARLQERIDAALSELDTQIKVSNVTTTIEF